MATPTVSGESLQSCSSPDVAYNAPRPTLQFASENTGPPEIAPEEIVYGQKIGGGCFGTVYKGKCRGKDVAVKKLFRQDMNEKTLRDFKKEVEICCQVRHPNIVLFMGACMQQGDFAIVTELLPKGNLQQLLHNPQCNLSLLQRMMMAKDVAHGMTWLHESKPRIIHRDMKPSNLLVGDHNVVKVCDFGLSAVCSQGEKLQDKDTIPGTPLWMAPEVLMGKPLDEKADIYSFGIVLWEIVTRQEPFPEFDSFHAFKRAICRFNTRPPIPKDVPPSLAQLLQACWHRDPQARPSFRDIITALDTVIIDVAISDEAGRLFWKDRFLGKDKVPWTHFSKSIAERLQISSQNFALEFKCLEHILAARDVDSTMVNPSKVVTLGGFGKVLGWFGPFEVEIPPRNVTLLDRIVDAIRCPYFFGYIEKDAAESKLSGKSNGTFLVRLSTTKQGAFTISKVSKSGNINHQRFDYKPGDGFSICIHHKLVKGDTLRDFIPKIEKALYLRKNCPDNPLEFLLREARVDGYIIPSDSDSDFDDF